MATAEEIIATLQQWFAEGVALQHAEPLQAAQRYQQILAVAPFHGDSWHNLALAWQALRDWPAMLAVLNEALQKLPAEARLLRLRAECHSLMEQWALALQDLQAASQLQALDVRALCLQGHVAQSLERYDLAFTAFEQAMQLQPSDPLPVCRMAALCVELGQYEDALSMAQHAARLDPLAAEPLLQQALACKFLDRWEEAEQGLRQALQRKPDEAGLWCDLGIVLHGMGRLPEAEQAFDAALQRDPGHPLGRWNRSLVLLAQGRYQEGWPEYQSRWRAAINGQMPAYPFPLWQGEPLSGKHLLVHGEQGLGDCLQFIRYLAPLQAMGVQLSLHMPLPLHALFRLQWPDISVSAQDPVAADYHIPLMDLPARLLQDRPEPLKQIPYLRADPRQLASWQQQLSALPGRKVGLVWQGSRRQGHARSEWLDARRSLPLARLHAALSAIPGISWVSLQKGYGSEARLAWQPHWPTEDAAARFDDFTDTAACLTQLDLLISVDTSVVHLAGALGVPVWMLNRFDGDWRWGAHEADVTWYATVRQYRQVAIGEWDQPLQRLQDDLRRWVQGS
ncbi:tetratricopeptide repeat protein [Leeia sp.]|uniref:tetratricopeptide repeat protein n=1 Tax=Leeia sp. TaxID=2884678 RepID=UPI0035B08DF0